MTVDPRFALALIVCLGCGDDKAGTTDTVPDTIVAETIDTTVPPDTVDTAPDTTPPDTEDTATPPDTTPVDTTPACVDRPVAFQPPTEPEPWNHAASEATTQLGQANHRGQDVIVQVGNPQMLIAKFAYSFFDKDMLCEDVDIWMQREVPCGAWQFMGTARTSDNPDDSPDCENHGTVDGIEDDGGRIFFEIPDAQAFPIGRWPVRMVLKGDDTLASFDLIVVPPGQQAIVTDIDGTLTTSDNELITEIALSIFDETYQQEAYPDSDKMLKLWYDKGYLIVYITGRPDLLRPMTERWVEPRFSPGALHLTDTNEQALPNDEGVGTYKKDFLNYLKGQGIDIVAAFGNATTDIYAYAQAGMPKNVTWIIGPHAGEEGTNALTGSYTSLLPTIEAWPEATVKAPPAFGWW